MLFHLLPVAVWVIELGYYCCCFVFIATYINSNHYIILYFPLEPVVPAQSSLLRVNVTYISLNLAAWLDGGCPITSMVVEYKV